MAARRTVGSHGERKQATILFADIVGSTELIAQLDAESSVERLRPAVETMVRAVYRFEGTVLRTLGDGVMAAFGVPNAREGHALLACQAALAMQDAVASLAHPTSIRIGLNSGEVITGGLDTEASVDQLAQGLTVHIAHRIEQVAEPGSIYLSRNSRSLVSAYCDTISVGARALKGIPSPVEMFRLIGLKPAVASDQFRDDDLVRLRGRESEFGILRQALLEAEQGAASAVGIAGAPGMGKSRLCYEFSEWCRKRQVKVLEARGHISGRATPLLPVLEMLRAFLRIAPDLDPVAARERVRDKLLALDPSFVIDMPLLSDLLGLPAPELASERLDARTRYARLRDLIRRIVKAVGQQPGVIIFEDLHWLDEPSRGFVETMVEAVHGTRMVMVLNYRPPCPHRWAELSHYRELPLAELSGDDIARVVRDLLGDDPTLNTMASYIARQSGGNPFFAEEMVRALAQNGTLIGKRGNYGLASSKQHDPALPATVEAMISERLDLLPEQDKTVLQIGAVVGKDFPLALVQEVAGIAADEARALFGRLCDLELIRASATMHGPGFAFRHPLIQEVAYATQLRSRRTMLHAAVAKALEGSPWGKLDEAASLLAHHCEAAGQLSEAAIYLQRAALWVGRTNSSEALADWKKVRWLLRDQPRSETNDKLRALACGRILGFGWREGMAAEEAKPYAEEALRFAREANDQKHLVVLMGSYGRILAASGAADDYVRLVREGLALADASSDPDGVLALNAMLNQAYLFAGLAKAALDANDTAAAAIETQSRSHDGVVLGLTISQILGFDVPQWILCLRVKTLVSLGRFEEAEACLAKALQVEPDNLYPVVQVVAHGAAVEMAWHRGDVAMAKRHAHEVARYADQSGMPYLLVAALASRAHAESTAGDFHDAVSHFREALSNARRLRAGLENEAKLLACLADSYDRAGDFALAGQVAGEAIEVARRRTDRIAELHARIVFASALCAMAPGRRSEAEAQLGHADRLLSITGAAAFHPLLHRVAKAMRGRKSTGVHQRFVQ